MGYLFLSISLLAGVTKGYCGKKMGNFANTVQSAVLLNVLRMSFVIFLTIIFSFCIELWA